MVASENGEDYSIFFKIPNNGPKFVSKFKKAIAQQ